MIIDLERIQKAKTALFCMQRFQWEQGCAAQAILEYEGVTNEVIMLCEAAIIRSAEDGRVGVMEKNESSTDPAAIGEALILSSGVTKRQDFQLATDKLYQYLKYKAPKTKEGILYHFDQGQFEQQIWVDAYYMAPPFLCKYGDTKEAMKQIKGFRSYLYDEERHLLSHIWDDKKKEFARKAFWGVGNGWALAGLSRVIGMLSKENKEDKDYLIRYLKELLNGCLFYQREDGLFHNVLDDPTSFIETNVAQMIAYTIYRGVKAGYLEKSFLKFADIARTAVYQKVDGYGYVRDVCGMPFFMEPGVASEGQAFFVLMEAALKDYCSTEE